MIYRSVLLAGVFAAVCLANPETIVFSGTATGSVNGVKFTNQPFAFTYFTDSTAVAPGTFCCTDNITTPAGTQASFRIGSTFTGYLTGIQAVFVNSGEQQMGMWFYDTQDWLDILFPINSYGLNSNFGPVTGTTFIFPDARPLPTTAGPIIFTSVTGATANVTVSTTPNPTPVITSVGTAYGSGIAQNTWIAIRGTNLVPNTTQPQGLSWIGPQDFSGGVLTTDLNGVGVTVNGKPATVSFYCSGTVASSICPADQINALTPIDPTTGPIQVVVKNGGVASAPFTITATTISPTFLQFKNNYVTATHANFSLLGPTTLYPGFSTPAAVGETIVLWAIGFGMPSTPIIPGSETQSGPLPTLPICSINGAGATVTFAGVVSPGLYQLNVVVPNGATNGDNKVICTYGGATTLSTNLISVAR